NAIQKALRKYADGNGGMLPPDLLQLSPFFDPPVDAAVLDRWELVATGTYKDARGNIINEKAPPVDPEFDMLFNFGANSSSSRSVNKTGDALEAAARAYAQANRGLLPLQPSQITPYLQEQIDPAAIQKFLAKRPAHVTTLDQLNALR